MYCNICNIQMILEMKKKMRARNGRAEEIERDRLLLWYIIANVQQITITELPFCTVRYVPYILICYDMIAHILEYKE